MNEIELAYLQGRNDGFYKTAAEEEPSTMGNIAGWLGSGAGAGAGSTLAQLAMVSKDPWMRTSNPKKYALGRLGGAIAGGTLGSMAMNALRGKKSEDNTIGHNLKAYGGRAAGELGGAAAGLGVGALGALAAGYRNVGQFSNDMYGMLMTNGSYPGSAGKKAALLGALAAPIAGALAASYKGYNAVNNDK